MKQGTILKKAVFSALILAGMTVLVSAQSPRDQGLNGDWLVKSDFNGRTIESILAFSSDQEGNVTGASFGFWGINELKDVTFEEGKLSYTQTRQGRDGETRISKFTGTLTEGVLSGTISGERGDYELKGNRMPRMPRAVGDWEMKYTVGDHEIVSTLKIRSDAEGKLSATWPSEQVEHTVTDIVLNRRDITFKRAIKMGDQEWQATFTGTLRGNEIVGTFASERGNMQATGTRMGGDIIGTWNLDVSSERGDSKNRLVVYPDMTARYGSTLVKGVALSGDTVTFKLALGWGDRSFTMDFTGKIAEGKITGEITSDRGTQKVTGTKVARRGRSGPRPS